MKKFFLVVLVVAIGALGFSDELSLDFSCMLGVDTELAMQDASSTEYLSLSAELGPSYMIDYWTEGSLMLGFSYHSADSYSFSPDVWGMSLSYRIKFDSPHDIQHWLALGYDWAWRGVSASYTFGASEVELVQLKGIYCLERNQPIISISVSPLMLLLLYY